MLRLLKKHFIKQVEIGSDDKCSDDGQSFGMSTQEKEEALERLHKVTTRIRRRHNLDGGKRVTRVRMTPMTW